MTDPKSNAGGRDDNVPRESIWSLRREDRPAFARWFVSLFLLGMAFLIWYEIAHAVSDGVLDTIKSIVFGVGPTGASAIVLTFFRFEGGDVVGVALDIHRQMQFEKGLKEGIKEGILEGREEGREEREALKARVSELEKTVARLLNAKSDDAD